MRTKEPGAQEPLSGAPWMLIWMLVPPVNATATITKIFIAGSSPMPISRAPPPEAEDGRPRRPRSSWLDDTCEPVVGASFRVAATWMPPVAPFKAPEKTSKPSRIIVCSFALTAFLSTLYDLGLITKDRVHRTHRNATEGRNRFAIELLDAEQDVGLVHRL